MEEPKGERTDNLSVDRADPGALLAAAVEAVVVQREAILRIDPAARHLQKDPAVVGRHLDEPRAAAGPWVQSRRFPADDSAQPGVVRQWPTATVLDPDVVDDESVNLGVFEGLVENLFQIQPDVEAAGCAVQHHRRRLISAAAGQAGAKAAEKVPVGHDQSVEIARLIEAAVARLALADGIEDEPFDGDPDAVVVRRLKPEVALELLIVAQQEPIRHQFDGSTRGRRYVAVDDPAAAAILGSFRQE